MSGIKSLAATAVMMLLLKVPAQGQYGSRPSTLPTPPAGTRWIGGGSVSRNRPWKDATAAPDTSIRRRF